MSEEQIFAEAIGMPSAAERARYVDHVCGADEQLKANVLSLLAAHDQQDSLLDQPADVGATKVASFVKDEFRDPDSETLVATKSIAAFRNGEDVEIFRVQMEDDVERSLYSLVFGALQEVRKGNRKGAVDRLDEAYEFAKKLVPTPDGPNFKWSNRAHAWAVSRVLLAEAQQAIELGTDGFDQETVRAVADLRRSFEERYGRQLARQLLVRVGSALLKTYGDEPTGPETDAESTAQPDADSGDDVPHLP